MPELIVQLFVTCLVDGFYPEVGEATVEVLEQHGCTVEFPFDQTCCGQPAFNGGYTADAQRMMRHTVAVLDVTEGPIVIPSGSCATMVINHAVELAEATGDNEFVAAAGRVAARTRELTQFLHDDLGVRELAASTQSVATYHASCHGLRGLGLREQPLELIGGIEGPRPVTLPGSEECCGFGGLFAVKMPDVSGAMLAAKLEAIETSGADVVVGTDVSCLMHISGGLRRSGNTQRTCHIAELLAGRVP